MKSAGLKEMSPKSLGPKLMSTMPINWAPEVTTRHLKRHDPMPRRLSLFAPGPKSKPARPNEQVAAMAKGLALTPLNTKGLFKISLS